MKISHEYIAGLVDGEGYISLIPFQKMRNTHESSYKPTVKITMCGKEAEKILIHLKDMFGGQLGYRDKENPKWTRSLTWSLTSKKVVIPFLEKIYPHLLVKKKSAEVIFKFVALPIVYNGKPEVNDPIREQKKKLYNEARSLTFSRATFND